MVAYGSYADVYLRIGGAHRRSRRCCDQQTDLGDTHACWQRRRSGDAYVCVNAIDDVIGRQVGGGPLSLAAVQEHGLGRALLGSALELLVGLGSREVILYVDDDDTGPRSDRNRDAANRIYDRAGFAETDRLVS